MKETSMASVFILLTSVASVFCQDITFSNKVATFTNLQGQLFKDVELVRADRVGLIWRNDSGGGRIAYSNLPPSMLPSCGLPTNYFEILRKQEEDAKEKREQERLESERRSQESARVARESALRSADDYFNQYASDVWVISKVDSPESPAAAKICKEILSELKQMDRAIELGLNYERFGQILADKGMAVEKLKDACSEFTFLRHADSCLYNWSRAKHWWSQKIAQTGSGVEALDDYYLHEYLMRADCELLCCKAIVDEDFNNRAAFQKVAEIIMAEQEALKIGTLPRVTTPLLPTMTTEEIVSKLRSAKEKMNKQARGNNP